MTAPVRLWRGEDEVHSPEPVPPAPTPEHVPAPSPPAESSRAAEVQEELFQPWHKMPNGLDHLSDAEYRVMASICSFFKPWQEWCDAKNEAIARRAGRKRGNSISPTLASLSARGEIIIVEQGRERRISLAQPLATSKKLDAKNGESKKGRPVQDVERQPSEKSEGCYRRSPKVPIEDNTRLNLDLREKENRLAREIGGECDGTHPPTPANTKTADSPTSAAPAPPSGSSVSPAELARLKAIIDADPTGKAPGWMYAKLMLSHYTGGAPIPEAQPEPAPVEPLAPKREPCVIKVKGRPLSARDVLSPEEVLQFTNLVASGTTEEARAAKFKLKRNNLARRWEAANGKRLGLEQKGKVT